MGVGCCIFIVACLTFQLPNKSNVYPVVHWLRFGCVGISVIVNLVPAGESLNSRKKKDHHDQKDSIQARTRRGHVTASNVGCAHGARCSSDVVVVSYLKKITL